MTLPLRTHGADNGAADLVVNRASNGAPAPVPVKPRFMVPDDAPAIFRKRLRWVYPAYRTYSLWADADGLRMSAAMSFYGLLSLAPLLLLIVVALGWWLGQDAVQANLIAQVSALIGPQGAAMLEGAISSTRAQSNGVFASIVALTTLMIGATGVFAELQSALERLWVQGSSAELNGNWWRTATLRLRGIAYVMAFGFLLLVSLVISSALGYVQNWADSHMGAALPSGLEVLMSLGISTGLNQLVSLLISATLFLGLLRMSAGPQPSLRHLVVGAVIGAVLFALGKQALAIYLRDAAVVSAYGAAGSLVVILFWIYFTSAVLLLAASGARVSAELRGDYDLATAVTAPPPTTTDETNAAVVNALADLAEPWKNSPSQNIQNATSASQAPKALNWATLLLAFSAGYALVNNRRAPRARHRT